MQQLAQNIIAHANNTPQTPERGRSSSLPVVRPRVRIGVWPLLSNQNPETAVGMAALLAMLLDAWQETVVYRIFVKFEDEDQPESYSWTPPASQFDVDQWHLDYLDENAAVWGAIEHESGRWQLTLNIENDLDTADHIEVLRYAADSLSQLVEQLPEASAAIALYLNLDTQRPDMPLYRPGTPNADGTLAGLFRQLCSWEANILLTLWGKTWPTSALVADHEALIDACVEVGGELGAWTAANASARAFSPVLNPVDEIIAQRVDEVIAAFPESGLPAAALGTALFNSGRAGDAYKLLDNAIDQYADDGRLYLAQANLQWRGGRFQDAAELLQDAIATELADAALYQRYAGFVHALYQNNLELVDPILANSDSLADEAIAAYERVLHDKPENLAVLSQLLALRLEVSNTDAFWAEFAQLAKLDDEGERLRTLVEQMDVLEDLEPAISVLEAAADANPDRPGLLVALASLYVMDEQPDDALTVLESAEALEPSSELVSEIERLRLLAEEPDFEARMGGIVDLLNAGMRLPDDEIEYLEDVVARAPSYADAYLHLAKAYERIDEPAAVLETLLDGQRNVPEDPEIGYSLVQALWDQDQRELALEYLNKALTASPYHVPLLALAGRYLFEEGDEDEARDFLSRAEAISPNHPVLNEVRRFIARMLDEE